jgi:hypothetical protein
VRPFQFKFALSAVQSLFFNDYLGKRLTDGLLRTVLPGDVMMKWPAGGIFVAEDVPVEQERFDRRETVTAGPMFGGRMYPAKGVAAERETQVLADNRLSPEAFAGFGKLMSGTRRHNLVYLDDLTADWEPDGLRLAFTLPSGCESHGLADSTAPYPMTAARRRYRRTSPNAPPQRTANPSAVAGSGTGTMTMLSNWWNCPGVVPARFSWAQVTDVRSVKSLNVRVWNP